MVAVGSARATMKSPAMAASARAGRRLESGCGRKPGRHCPRGEGPMWSNRPSFRFAPVLKGRGRAPDRRPGGGRSTACEATGVPWTADQAWGLVVGFALVAVWFFSTKVDEIVAGAQRRQLGLKQVPDEEDDQV